MSLGRPLFLLMLCYLWGSIPFGYLLVKKAMGKNIMDMGSGNIGSTNVGRVAGKKWALFTQLLDMAKGWLPVALFMFVEPQQQALPLHFIYALALAAILGHNFSIFLMFKGGKGVNTTLGASVLLTPWPVFIAVAVYFLVKWRFKYVSLGSLVLGFTMPLAEFIISGRTPGFYYLLIAMVLIVLMHHQNIRRLLNRNELEV